MAIHNPLGPWLLVPALCLGQGNTYDSPDLGFISIYPKDNPWHWDISAFPVHPNSERIVAHVGAGTSLHPDFGSSLDGVPWGIPYVLVDGNQAPVAVEYTAYGDESDPGPYPIPLTAPVEGGPASDGDRHVLAVDTDGKVLYELYRSFPRAGRWDAESGARFDLTSNALRMETWTSADAAGLPILPGLVRYDEVARGEIDHAIRMTVKVSRRSYLWPARHHAGSTMSDDAPPMGMRFRLKKDVDISAYPQACQVILRAMKKHGLIVADNGGNWYVTGSPHSKWPDGDISLLKRLKGSDFEAVLSVGSDGKPIYPQGLSVRPRLALRGNALEAMAPAWDPAGRRLPGVIRAVLPILRETVPGIRP